MENVSKPPASQNAPLLPMGSLWWVVIFYIQVLSLIWQRRRRDFPTDGYSEEELNSDTLQLYLSYCTWAQFQALHLEACTRHVLVQVLTRLWAFLSHIVPQRDNTNQVVRMFCSGQIPSEGGGWLKLNPMHKWTWLASALLSGIASGLPPIGKGILRTQCSDVLMADDANTPSVHPLGTSVTGHLKPCKGPEMQCVA